MLNRTGWFLAALMCFATPGWCQEAAPDEMQRIFQRLLENPSDPTLNFRYAELAITQNRVRSALAAYERILAGDPNNEQAKAGIRRIRQMLAPEFTAVTLSLGGQYETNPRLAGSGRAGGGDFSLAPQAEIVDEHRLGDLRLRSEGQVFADFYKRFDDINYGKVSATTGPVLGVGDWNVRPAVGAGYAWLNGDSFYGEGITSLSVAPQTEGPLRRINLQFSYDWINGRITHRDAFQIELSPQFYWVDQLTTDDAILVTPFYRYNGVTGTGPAGSGVGAQPFPLESHQFGGRVDYYLSVFQDYAIDANFTGYYQPFNELVTNGTNHRHDRYLAPGIQFIVKGFLSTHQDVVLGYLYEDNHSNDSTETYRNQTVSLRSVWRF